MNWAPGYKEDHNFICEELTAWWTPIGKDQAPPAKRDVKVKARSKCLTLRVLICSVLSTRTMPFKR